MHLEVLIGAVAKKLRAARPKVGEPGDVLLGRRGGCLVQADRGHACPLSLPGTSGILSLVLITHLGRFCTCAACRFESDASATADHNNRLSKELRFTVDGRGDSDGRACAWGCAHKDLHSN